jgi:hypothetical protein
MTSPNKTTKDNIYAQVLDLVTELGDQLPPLAGQIADIGIKNRRF